MIEINLFDYEFSHIETEDGYFSLVDNRRPTYFKYAIRQTDWDGVTLFTDRALFDGSVDRIDSKYKIGWILETREVRPDIHNNIEDVIDKVDFIMTYDDILLARYPEKAKFYPIGGCWIDRNDYEITDKNKLLSLIYSNKIDTVGHKLRHSIAHNVRDNIDLYGSGSGRPFEFDDMKNILSPYYFSVVVENGKSDFYFSEKILNALACGSVPIYYGANKIDNFLNEDGIITFDSVEELESIVATLTPELYYEMMPSIVDNMKRVQLYDIPEDWIFENIFIKEGLVSDSVTANNSLEPSDERTYCDDDIQRGHLDDFFSVGGDEMLYYDFDLDSSSVVIDVGSYDGEFSKIMHTIYGCYCYGYEPSSTFYGASKQYENDKVKFFNYALGALDGEQKLDLSLDASSFHGSNLTNNYEICSVKNICNVLDGINRPIDLLKLNIEGSEYEVLEELLDKDYIKNIKNILVQFHYVGDFPVLHRNKIKRTIEKTHDSFFSFPFVWEAWTLNEPI